MPSINIVRESGIERTGRVLQLEGLFDVAPSKKSRVEWTCDLPIEEQDWNIGLILGASGSGKSTVLAEMFGGDKVASLRWSKTKAVVEGFRDDLSIREITGALSSVGFSSPPSWLRPHSVLSTGEQFRANIARVMIENKSEIVGVDEFTSVVDRTVAKVGSAAIAKSVRRNGQKLVAASCHYDIVEWLQPDWTYEPAENLFQWRSVQRFPEIVLRVEQVHSSAWEIFKRHHYMSAKINRAAQCFVAFWDDRPVAFDAYLPFPHPKRPRTRRETRVVVLPDFQGIGIGKAVSSLIGEKCLGEGFRFIASTGHPANIEARRNSPLWRMTNSNARDKRLRKRIASKHGDMARATRRSICSFEYIGKPRAASPLAADLLQV